MRPVCCMFADAQVFANVCVELPAEYSDYEKFELSYGNQDEYSVRGLLSSTVAPPTRGMLAAHVRSCAALRTI